jgi:hypothetical protein
MLREIRVGTRFSRNRPKGALHNDGRWPRKYQRWERMVHIFQESRGADHSLEGHDERVNSPTGVSRWGHQAMNQGFPGGLAQFHDGAGDPPPSPQQMGMPFVSGAVRAREGRGDCRRKVLMLAILRTNVLVPCESLYREPQMGDRSRSLRAPAQGAAEGAASDNGRSVTNAPLSFLRSAWLPRGVPSGSLSPSLPV